MERHDTHAVSSYSRSSNNHSYDFDNNHSKKSKKINSKKLNLRNVREINEPQLSNIQLKKINSILNKYNIVSEQSQKNEELSKHQKKTENNKEEQEIKLDKNILTTKNNAGDPNRAKRKDSKKIKKKKTKDSNKDKENNKYIKEKGKEENKDNKEEQKKEENKKEEEKIEEIYKKEETTKNDDLKYENEKLKYYVSYRKNIKDTRFNNIQKILDDENKKKIKLKKLNNRNKENLLIYKEVNVKQDNLVREIKKPPISFITKIFKGLDQQLEEKNQMEENSGLLLTVKNNYGFYTKQFVRNKEYNKKIKQIKYQKMKEEIKDEKIPTFSSINTSSSNSLFKTKSKSKSKKKTFKSKNKIKPKSFGKKKQNLFPKSTKPQRSISVYSKVSKEKSDEGKKNTSKKRKIIIPNIKKKQTYVSDKKITGVNKDIRKYSVVNRYNGKFSNIQKDIDKKDENKKINENNNEKENRELDFKKFLEQQKIKKSRQIKNYIKKNGINSYNFFYPKEPSPLLGTFKNKYSIYPTLYLDRKNSVDIGANNNIIINHRHFYKVRCRPRKGKTFYEKENSTKENDYLHNLNKNKNNNIHLVDKHYGLEKDCPICRAFQMKKLNDDFNSVNYIKSMKYKKLKINENMPRLLSPNSFGFINERDYSSLSRNRNSSARKSEYIDEYSQIRRNFVAVFDYFNL